jgi:DNA-binding MarR family transcriptional regulator
MSGPTSDENSRTLTSIQTHVETALFAGTMDSLEAFTARKQALAHPIRYALLYRICELKEVEQPTLVEESGFDLSELHEHLRPLLDANLVARIPAPGGIRGKRTYYRITTLGRDEIESDIATLQCDQ